MRNSIVTIWGIALIIFSCNSNEKIDIYGVWYTYITDFGYSEFEIDTTRINIFTRYSGNKGTYHYRIVEDSIFYEIGFKAKIIKIDDNTLEISYDNMADTLFRINEEIETFNPNTMSSNDKTADSLFQNFYDNFSIRAKKYMEDHNILNNPFDNSDDSTIIEYDIFENYND